MKKLIAILLTMILVLSFGAAALAEDVDTAEPAKNDSITVNGTKVGETYKLYKMFDLKVNSETEPTAYTYAVNADWASFFGEGGAGADFVTINKVGAVTEVSDAAALAEAAAKFAKDKKALQTVKAETETVKFENLADGYYLITSTLGTKAMIETTPDKAAVTVNEKNPEDTIEKKVKEGESLGKENDAQIGDKVEFESTAKLVPGTRNVKITDTMTDGLTYNKDLTIAGLTEGTEYTVEETDHGFVVTFVDSYIESLKAETSLTLSYSATLNTAAVVTGKDGKPVVDPQTNKTKVTFGDGTSSEEDQTTTTTHKFSVFKHATNKTENLAGAVFSLKKAGTVVKLIKLDDNNYRVANGEETDAVDTFTTVESGDIVIWGVDADNDYTLFESAAPAGYNKLAEEVKVTVDAGNATRADVENKSGNELPSTGGIGTTLFYVIGGLMVTGAVVVLVSKKRMEQ